METATSAQAQAARCLFSVGQHFGLFESSFHSIPAEKQQKKGLKEYLDDRVLLKVVGLDGQNSKDSTVDEGPGEPGCEG
jgi:hypothetical protein